MRRFTWLKHWGLSILLFCLLFPVITPVHKVQAQSDYDCSSATGLPQSECEALVAIYDATDGDNWNSNTGWLQTTTPCEWHGVTCESARVTRLYLGVNNVQNDLPAEIGNLTALTTLDLWGNALTSLPAEIGNLTALTYLHLNDNALASLPPEIGNLTALLSLNLWGNVLTSLPAEIGNLTALTLLDLWGNALTSLPAEIGNLTALTYLYLEGNALTSLPPEIWNLTALTTLSLEGNALTSLPAEIGNLTALTELNLGGNALTSLPPEIWNLTALTTLDLGGNALTSLPGEIGNLTALSRLFLENNPFSGEVPVFLTALTSIQFFSFSNTGWCVPISGAVPDWLASIDYVSSTGQICDQEPGGLSGSVSYPDTTPAAGVQVDLYRPVTGASWHYVTTTQTTAAGTYQFDGLGQGIDYRVHFVDPQHRYAPEYYDNQATLNAATPVTITLGETRTGIDAVLNFLPPPAATIETDGGSVTPNPLDGTVVINVAPHAVADIMVTRVVTCASGTPTSVTLTLTPPGQDYAMVLTGADRYQATIPGSAITQDGDLVVYATCGVTTTETTVGHINLYDPSGTVTDAATEQPVVGATVTLYRVPGWVPKTGPDDNRPNTCESHASKDSDAPWSQPAPTELGVVVNPAVTTVDPALAYQVTDSAGYYGWDVGEGCWYVAVTAPGYYTFTSPVVGVPPEVTDLDLALSPVAVAPLTVSLTGPDTGAIDTPYAFTATVNPTATTPLTYTWQAVPAAPLTYVSGLSHTVAVSWTTPGPHTLVVTATNSVGVVTNTLAFTAVEPLQAGVVKSATPVVTLTNGSLLTYTLVITASDDTTLYIYDPLAPGLVWQGFAGVVPDTLTYTTALTGSVAVAVTETLSVSYVVQVDLPLASFVSEYAQVSNTAYYYFPGETLTLMRPSNTVTRIVRNEASFEVFLPLVLKGS